MPSSSFTFAQVMAQGLKVARGYAAAGIHEEGGNNMGDEVEFMQDVAQIPHGSSWCLAFVLTCLLKGYAQLRGLPGDRASLLGLVDHFCASYGLPRTGYCPTMWKALDGLGLTAGPGEPVAAPAIVFFDFHEQGEPHHVAFLVDDTKPGHSVVNIAGNTPAGLSGDQREGDGVYEKAYGRGALFGFGVAA